ncbi:uncharacterized protein LOC127871230 [Dreissena polymorpha]|uniref:uncharacterized protein LOC127871230 n=1 Tax=Dreissena polymorpha TaxID=45954 RepID=UPI002264FFE8|nr:uncharacterized protein LOC127871230 [Dreissena polymorpha]
MVVFARNDDLENFNEEFNVSKMKTMFLRFLLCTILPIFVIPKDPGQIFYGGAISYYLTKLSTGNVSATVELVTGWQLGKGPCGPNCSKASIGKSTLPYRTLVERDNDEYFGNITTDYKLQTEMAKQEIRLMNSIVKANMTETVIAVSEDAQWEQELMTFSFELLRNTTHEDVNFDGKFWRHLTFSNSPSAWHLQTTIQPGIRNDTGEQNHCPVVLTRPFYRILLNQTTKIDLPAIDDDGDFVKCKGSQYIEIGELDQANGTNVSEECSIAINAFESNGYKNDTWIAVAINVKDYPKTAILFGDQMQSSKFSMCTTAAQLLINVLDHLVTPVFVSPTLEDNHVFVIYVGAMWATDVYAQAPNTTIDEFTVTGRRQEGIHVSSLRNHNEIGHLVRSVQLSWIPDNKYSEHIICVTAVDTYGVESGQQRCFIIDLRTQVFNYTLTPRQDKPYFLDVPSTEDLIKCPAEATCIIPIFVKSIRNVTFASIVESFMDYAAIGPIQRVLRNGEYVYQFDFSFRHSLYEKMHLCLEASDDTGVKTEQLCFKTSIEPPDPCFSSPCMNSAQCQQRNDSSGLFDCLCIDGYNGKYCENVPDVCTPNPCIHGTCYDSIRPFFCYCSDDGVNQNDYSGELCETKIDDCATNPCNNHSMCIDGVLSSKCECFTRYNRTDCRGDLCPTSNSSTTCSDNNGCSQLCRNSGVCFKGECKCTVGFTGPACEYRVGNVSAILNSVSFVPPTPKNGGIIVCSVENTTIIACGVQIYVASKTGLVPLVTMSASDDIRQASTVGPTVRQDLFQGVDNEFTSYVTIKGRPQDINGHYVCITATDSSNSTMNDTTCYQLKFDLNGGLNPMPQVHFVEPAPQTDSTFVCYINERCSVILYTNNVTKCEHVVSAGVKFTVFGPLDNKDGRCVTEVMISTETIDDFTGCFRSTESNYEERCFQFSIIDKNTDPCASSGDIIHGYCQNHGICFTTGRTDYQCFCNGEGYTGKNCSKGPCVPEDNKCSTNGYCITDDHVITCMCKNGFTGDTCDTDIGGTFAPSITDGARFINTGKPKEVNCNRKFLCGTYASVGGSFKAGERPVVNVGYVSPELEIKDFKTISQNSSTTLFQTFVTFMPKEEGTFDLCLQTLNNARVNKDETCFVVRVTEGTDTVYGLLENPHFVYPSLQPDSIVECKFGTECHVMYTVTPGNGHSQECIDFKVGIPETEKSHVFTTCRSCVDGNVSNHECTIDIAIRPVSDPRVCLSLQIATSGLKGEERCFSVSTIPALDAGKKGCQLLECQNNGFCDGHDPTHPTCFCRPGFSGRNCETDLKIPNGGCQNTFMTVPVTTEIECSFENCTYPFQACRDSSVAIKSGFLSPQLDVYIPFATGSSPITCECKTVTTSIVSSSTGRFSFCLQLTDENGFVHDEICPIVVVKGAYAKNEVDKDKPFFITPTLPTGSSVLCEVSSACQLTVYYTDGAKFGSSQVCPSLKQSSLNLLDGLHIFPPIHMTRDCKNEITYQPQENITAGQTRQLCLSVSVPG